MRGRPAPSRPAGSILAAAGGLLVSLAAAAPPQAGTGGPAASSSAPAVADPPPSAPAAVVATAVSPTEVLVTWSPVTDAEGGVKNYNVYRDDVRVGAPTTTAFTDTGLTPGTTYAYRVSAVDSLGREGEKSPPVTVTTPEDGGSDDGNGQGEEEDETPPSRPDGLMATAANPRRVELSWNAARDEESGVAGYRVYRDGVRVGDPAETSFADEEVEPETTYTYRVSAVNGAGTEGEPSPPATVTTPAEEDRTPPAPPTGLRIVR